MENVSSTCVACTISVHELACDTSYICDPVASSPLEAADMEDADRLRVMYMLAVAQRDADEVQLNIAHFVHRRLRWRRGQRNRAYWTRGWISRRRQFGLYDQLMVELRNEDPVTFKNFMRMPPEMFDEVLERVRHRITKQYTFYRDPLEPGLKLAIALRHLASGSKYSDMKFGWRVPPNTIFIVVREVCKAIVEEYLGEVMTPHTTPDEWRRIADQFVARWNFPHTCGALDGKHAACRCPHKSGSTYYNYMGFYSIVMMGLVDADYRFIWADVGGKNQATKQYCGIYIYHCFMCVSVYKFYSCSCNSSLHRRKYISKCCHEERWPFCLGAGQLISSTVLCTRQA